MKKIHKKSLLSIFLASCATTTFAATPIDLDHQSPSILQQFQSINNEGSSIAKITSEMDFNATTHTRIQQLYAGHRVWSADAVTHTPNTKSNITMNGTLFSALEKDLGRLPTELTTETAANNAIVFAIKHYQTQTNKKFTVNDSNGELIVYIDDKNQAHWAYLIRFFAKPSQGMPALPTYIIDATTKTLYKQWNDLKTLDNVDGGGVGGNEGKIGKLIYDGGSGHFPKLIFQRDNKTKTCYLQNNLTIVRDRSHNDKIPNFACAAPDPKQNNVYWNTNSDYANGGYSPIDDAIYSDTVVRDLYKSWFNIDMLTKRGKPMQVTMIVHDPSEGQNAYYYNGEMVFGEGDNESYPVVAPSVVAHEMTHGFTEQHSNLIYDQQSGGLNEAFSDMADKAVEYKVYGKNNWQIDPELLKEGGRLLRWMDDPTQDCHGRQPGDYCSIDHTKYYQPRLDVHFSSGVYNKAFYLLSTSKGWNTKKAFEVMTQANRFYWTANTTFDKAACGVIKATKDYKYDVDAVIKAMTTVGVETNGC